MGLAVNDAGELPPKTSIQRYNIYPSHRLPPHIPRCGWLDPGVPPQWTRNTFNGKFEDVGQVESLTIWFYVFLLVPPGSSPTGASEPGVSSG